MARSGDLLEEETQFTADRRKGLQLLMFLNLLVVPSHRKIHRQCRASRTVLKAVGKDRTTSAAPQTVRKLIDRLDHSIFRSLRVWRLVTIKARLRRDIFVVRQSLRRSNVEPGIRTTAQGE